MQRLRVSLNIIIPDDLIVISKVELNEYKKNELTGIYWTMQELERRVGRKSGWIKENILYPPRFRKELDVANGGFVFYPRMQGQHWAFQASKMAKFLDRRFSQIFGQGGDA